VKSRAPLRGPLDSKALVTAIRNEGQTENPVNTPSRTGLRVIRVSLDVEHPPQVFLVRTMERRR